MQSPPTELPPSLVIEPGLRKRSRDPFGRIVAIIGILLVVGLPLTVVALALDNPLVLRGVVAVLIALAALLAIATVGVAFRESVRRRLLRFTLQDVFWLTLAIALLCALVVNEDELMQAGLFVAFISVISLWWARPDTWDSPKDYLTQVIGNGIGIALIVCTLWGLFGAFVFVAVRGIGR